MQPAVSTRMRLGAGRAWGFRGSFGWIGRSRHVGVSKDFGRIVRDDVAKTRLQRTRGPRWHVLDASRSARRDHTPLVSAREGG